jgi:hypothetical protein
MSMKNKIPLIVSLGLLVSGAAYAANADKSVSPVQVTFQAPENFTDVREDYTGSDRGRDAILEQLKDHLVAQAAKYLAAGQRLQITVNDVDLAGDFEPWRGMNFQDVRVVKDIYPPRVSLDFKLLDAEGKVISEGKRQLRDLSFQMTVALPSSDPLRYDKEMLSNWLRQEFKRRT